VPLWRLCRRQAWPGRVRTLPSVLLAGWRGSAGLRLTSRLKAAGGGVVRSYRSARWAALGPLERSGCCAACQAWRVGARRTADLVLAAVADDRTAEVYAGAHGLCVRHVLGLADAGGLPARVLEARLAVAGWELAEADRKRSWSARHEPQATEAGAWLRAFALLDGQVFGGGPATALPQAASWAGMLPAGPSSRRAAVIVDAPLLSGLAFAQRDRPTGAAGAASGALPNTRRCTSSP
jgi:hypothetical protein